MTITQLLIVTAAASSTAALVLADFIRRKEYQISILRAGAPPVTIEDLRNAIAALNAHERTRASNTQGTLEEIKARGFALYELERINGIRTAQAATMVAEIATKTEHTAALTASRRAAAKADAIAYGL